MLVSEIARRVRNQFGDSTGVVLTDQAIYDYINDAMADIALANGLLQVKATTPTGGGVRDYAVPNNLLTLIAVHYNDNKLNNISAQEADMMRVSNPTLAGGTPISFSQYGDVVSLYPTPDAVGTLSLYYTREPAAVTDMGDTPEIAIGYHTRIVEFCLAKAAELDDDPNAAFARMQQFNANVNGMKDNAEWLERDFYPSITAGLADVGDGFSRYYDF